MWITNKYLGVTRNNMRCLFFLLLEDYIEEQRTFARDLDLELERFARNLGQNGALVRPFTGDIEATKTHILDKKWTREQLQELRKTPALLMINVDFNEFDPQEHPWFLLNFDEHTSRSPSVRDFRDVLENLSDSVNANSIDIFKEAPRIARSIKNEVRFSDVAEVFEAKVGVFGFSIDLIKGWKLLYRRIC